MSASARRILLLGLLASGPAMASAAHSKALSIEPLDTAFHIGESGTIEASLNPPIQGVLRIIVRAGASASGPQRGGSAGGRMPLTLEVTQWDRTIPFRVVRQSGRRHLFGGRPPMLIADIDVNDLTPGVPVRVCVHSNLPSSSNSDPPSLDGRAYAVVF